MSTGDRTQFHLGVGDERIVEELGNLEHSQWPAPLELDRTKVTRIAVRVLWAHAAAESQKEWVIVRDGEPASDPIAIRRPDATSRTKFDVALDEHDRRRLQQLVEMKVADSETSALRIAIAHLRDIGTELQRNTQLMARWRGSVPHELVELTSIVLDTTPVVVARGFLFPLQADATPTPLPQQPIGSVRTREEELAALLFLVVAFNRFLATKIAWINDEAKASEETAPTEADVAKIQRDFDLLNLLDEFCYTGKADLRTQFEEHQLLPKSSTRDDESFNKWLTAGQTAVREYLVARSKNLSPWPGSSDLTKNWRNWTRSRLVVEDGVEYRECPAALEWTAVLHYWLINHNQVSPEMVAHELQTWLVQAFGVRNNDHVERLADSCARFNRAFYELSTAGASLPGINERRLTLQKLLYELACLEPNRTAAEEAQAVLEESESIIWARFVFLLLSSARVVQAVYRWERFTKPRFEQVQPRVASLTRAELSEIRARVFGGQTAIDGLHWILHGGIVPRVRSGRSWLVYGKPGCGKSTFALHLAADMARRGRIGVVFSDERSEVINERLLMFGLRDDDRFHVITRARFEELLHSERPEEPQDRLHGLLVIFNATREEPKQDLAQWLSMVSTRARALRESFAREAREASKQERANWLRRLERRWRWLSVVVDSIDALEVESRATQEERTNERTAMAELVRVIEMSRFWGLLVCGTHSSRKDTVSDLTDAVVELDVEESGMHRTLQFLKCRTQPYDSGKHVLELREGHGVEIYPNLASIQRRVRRRPRPPLDRERIIPFPRHVFWPKLLPPGADDFRVAPVPVNAPVNWPSIRRGSAVLMYGAAQTGKSPFLMNLMSQRIQLVDRAKWRLGTNGATLIVSFRNSAQELVRSLQESKGLSEQWRDNVSLMRFCDYGVDETLVGSQITFELIRRIRRLRRDAVPLDWIAFVGLEALPFNLPRVARERSFWPTIFAIAANEGITTAFMLDDETRASEFVTQHSQEMDYVLRFTRNACTRVLTIEKSADPPPPDGYPTLEFDPAIGPVQRVVATSGIKASSPDTP